MNTSSDNHSAGIGGTKTAAKNQTGEHNATPGESILQRLDRAIAELREFNAQKKKQLAESNRIPELERWKEKQRHEH